MPGKLKKYPAGSVIYEIGDVGGRVYLLKSGAVDLTAYSVETGGEAKSTVMGGSFFGAGSALASRPREETAVAREDTEALELDGAEFEKLLEDNPSIAEQFFKSFTGRLKKIGRAGPARGGGGVDPARGGGAEHSGGAKGGRGSILVIDDSTETLELLRRVMEKEGYETILAKDGEKGLSYALEDRPDAIVLERLLPSLNGIQVVRRLREREETKDTPVIFLSVLDTEHDVIEGLRAGADDYVTKPFSPDELLARIERMLARLGRSGSGGR